MIDRLIEIEGGVTDRLDAQDVRASALECIDEAVLVADAVQTVGSDDHDLAFVHLMQRKRNQCIGPLFIIGGQAERGIVALPGVRAAGRDREMGHPTLLINARRTQCHGAIVDTHHACHFASDKILRGKTGDTRIGFIVLYQ